MGGFWDSRVVVGALLIRVSSGILWVRVAVVDDMVGRGVLTVLRHFGGKDREELGWLFSSTSLRGSDG